MRYENLRRSWASAADTASGVRLALATAVTSHPRWRTALQPLLRGVSHQHRLWTRVHAGEHSLRACLRLPNLKEDLLSFREVILSDCYELSRLPEPDVIIDGGANVGFMTLLAGARWPRARIVAVEPLPDNASLIEEHLQANGTHATVTRSCLGAEAGSCTFYRRTANRGSVFEDDPYTTSIEVPVITLGKLRRDTGPGTCLVKLDIEGAEVDVLREFLAVPQPDCTIVGELHRWPERQAEFEKVLSSAGFSVQYHARDAVCVLFHARPE